MVQVVPVFIDLEASSVLPGSYPVEVGWAEPRRRAGDGRWEILVRSVLVRPLRFWRTRGLWDPDAEAVHGLSREALDAHGRNAQEVAHLLDEAWQGRVVVADSGANGVDARWLARLYAADARGRPSFADRPWRLAAEDDAHWRGGRCATLGLDPWAVLPAVQATAPPHTHAAGQDALVEAWVWCMLGLLAQVPAVAGAPRAEQAALAARLRDTLPDSRWPMLAPESRYRRRHGDPADGV